MRRLLDMFTLLTFGKNTNIKVLCMLFRTVHFSTVVESIKVEKNVTAARTKNDQLNFFSMRNNQALIKLSITHSTE